MSWKKHNPHNNDADARAVAQSRVEDLRKEIRFLEKDLTATQKELAELEREHPYVSAA